jgi:hypothetical protein
MALKILMATLHSAVFSVTKKFRAVNRILDLFLHMFVSEVLVL